MTKIVIVGAGRIGVACAKILKHIGEVDVALTDVSPESLASAVALGFETRVAIGKDQLEMVLRDLAPTAIICATPFFINIQVADIANRLACHYIDFTEDVSVTKAIEGLGVSRVTFVPQTGLAPGLVSYLGLSLFAKLGQPLSLDLRVGALPQVSFGPDHYAITWSPEGLMNEYINEAERKVAGVIENIAALSDEEEVIVNGIHYEGFTTSGGVGNLAAYENIPSVEYKTLRYPGHLEFIQKMLAQSAEMDDLNDAVAAAKKAFNTTRDDVVVMMVRAVDTDKKSAAKGIHFYPHDALDLTAIELTTAGTGVAVLELILRGELPAGVLRPDQIPMDLIYTTKSYELIFASAR
jgi:saccharopine dehydrogenase-like NADP-dependent oxidoreductase